MHCSQKSTPREDATRTIRGHLWHRFLAGGFCGVVAPAAALVFALAAWGRFCAVVRAGAADCRDRLSRGSASAAASPRSRFRVVDAPAGGGVRPRAPPAACSPRVAVSADGAARFAPAKLLLGRFAPAPPRTAGAAGAAAVFGADFAAAVFGADFAATVFTALCAPSPATSPAAVALPALFAPAAPQRD